MRILAITVLFALLGCAPAEANPFWRDRHFWAGFAIDATATVADYTLTQECLTRVPGCYESNRIFGSPSPSFQRMAILGLPEAFGWAYLGHRAGESRFKAVRLLWWVPSAIDATSHTRAAIRNPLL